MTKTKTALLDRAEQPRPHLRPLPQMIAGCVAVGCSWSCPLSVSLGQQMSERGRPRQLYSPRARAEQPWPDLTQLAAGCVAVACSTLGLSLRHPLSERGLLASLLDSKFLREEDQDQDSSTAIELEQSRTPQARPAPLPN